MFINENSIIINGKSMGEYLEDIAEILDSATQTVSYYDPYLKRLNTMTTYTGDWTLVNRGIAQNQSFSISFISVSKRSNS